MPKKTNTAPLGAGEAAALIAAPSTATYAAALMPFAALAADDVHQLLADAGFHSFNERHRGGSDAFTVRPDVTVIDACESTRGHLKALVGLLEMLSQYSELEAHVNDALYGCRMLAEQACAFHAVTYRGLLQHQQGPTA